MFAADSFDKRNRELGNISYNKKDNSFIKQNIILLTIDGLDTRRGGQL
jgi:hypothetical protein